jgi:hypothetical protein
VFDSNKAERERERERERIPFNSKTITILIESQWFPLFRNICETDIHVFFFFK